MKPGLIELLLVAGIISILVAIVVPNYFDARIRAQATEVRLDLNRVEGALLYYHIDTNRFPPSPRDDPMPLRHLEKGPWLSSPAYDRFKETAPKPNPFSNPPYLDYGFVDAREAQRSVGPWMGKRSITAVGEWPRPDGRQVWVVASVGPARMLAPLGLNLPTPYDPTNGVLSAGKIYRVGPP